MMLNDSGNIVRDEGIRSKIFASRHYFLLSLPLFSLSPLSRPFHLAYYGEPVLLPSY